jgi:hypothetical protein
MRKRVGLIVIAVVGLTMIAWAVAQRGMWRNRSRAETPEPQQVTTPSIVTATPATNPMVVAEESIDVVPPATVTTTAPAVVEVKKPTPAPAAALKVTRKPVQVAGGSGKPAKQPLSADQLFARDALSLVGADPDAEAVWASAINDPMHSEHERKDLIEDLNEEGFADPKNLTPDDLPLIVNRLAIIEQLAPTAMDDVNDAAFAEAYKDLVNMYRRAASGQ